MRTIKRATKEILANILDSDEAERLSRRKDIRRRLAEQRVLRQRWEALDAHVREAESRLDQLADEHSAKTAPIQTRLEQLDEKEIDQLAAGGAADPSIAKDRAELGAQLRELNEAFETAAGAKRRIIARLRTERAAVGPTNWGTADESQLTSDVNADPQLVVERFVLAQESQFLAQRLRAAETGLLNIQTSIENELLVEQPSQVEKFAWRLPDPEPNLKQLQYLRKHERKWLAELGEVRRLRDENLRRSNELHSKMLEE